MSPVGRACLGALFGAIITLFAHPASRPFMLAASAQIPESRLQACIDHNLGRPPAPQAFLKAFREIAKLRDDRAFSGYLYRICVRLCMDRLRLKKAELIEFDSAQPHSGGAVENRVVVEKLLTQLPYDLRTTLVLREMEQLSYEEVAEVMRVPIGTVRSRLHTARERFRKLWLEAVGE